MIITIEGKPGEGKTTLAKTICHGKKTYKIFEHDLNSPFWTQQMDYDTEIIIVEEVRFYSHTYAKFRFEKMKINKRGKECVEVNMPDVVLVLDDRISRYLKYMKACDLYIAKCNSCGEGHNFKLKTCQECGNEL